MHEISPFPTSSPALLLSLLLLPSFPPSLLPSLSASLPPFLPFLLSFYKLAHSLQFRDVSNSNVSTDLETPLVFWQLTWLCEWTWLWFRPHHYFHAGTTGSYTQGPSLHLGVLADSDFWHCFPEWGTIVCPVFNPNPNFLDAFSHVAMT